MIDLHLHILPEVDDGPATIEEALTLAQSLVQDGVRAAIATPHYNDEFVQRSAAEIRWRVAELQRALALYHIPLRLFAGHEALISPALVEDVQCGRVATLNGSRYLLLELWSSTWLPETEQVIFELRTLGITPIIAHPERSQPIQQDPHRLAVLLQRGALAQLTAGSLTGDWGKTIQKHAEALLKKGFIHCIASDAHGMQKRPPHVRRSVQRAVQLVGAERARHLVETLPQAIIRNEPLWIDTSYLPYSKKNVGRGRT